MLNSAVIMGRLSREPELKKTANGVPVVSFSLAVERDSKNADGTREVDFIPVVAWRGTAEFLSRYFRKGSRAVIAGQLQTRKYTDKNGNNRETMEVVARNVYFGESKQTDTLRGIDADVEPEFDELEAVLR